MIHVSADGTCRPGATMEGVLWYSLLALNDGLLLAGASDGLHLLQISPDGTSVLHRRPQQRHPFVRECHGGTAREQQDMRGNR